MTYITSLLSYLLPIILLSYTLLRLTPISSLLAWVLDRWIKPDGDEVRRQLDISFALIDAKVSLYQKLFELKGDYIATQFYESTTDVEARKYISTVCDRHVHLIAEGGLSVD